MYTFIAILPHVFEAAYSAEAKMKRVMGLFFVAAALFLIQCGSFHPAAQGVGPQGPAGPAGPAGPTGPQGPPGLGTASLPAIYYYTGTLAGSGLIEGQFNLAANGAITGIYKTTGNTLTQNNGLSAVPCAGSTPGQVTTTTGAGSLTLTLTPDAASVALGCTLIPLAFDAQFALGGNILNLTGNANGSYGAESVIATHQ